LRLAQVAVGLVLAGLILGARPARAQKGVFGTLTAVFAPSGSGYSSYGTAGAGVGLYDTFLKGGPVGVGFEVRGLAAPSTYELMAGGRLAVNGKKFRPYGVLVLGLEGQRNGFQSTSSQFGYQAGGGLDISQGRWFDWRAVDITGGELLTVSTGLVVRF
jgi:multisubunit Na+/H+ antiporter MnhB subunit